MIFLLLWLFFGIKTAILFYFYTFVLSIGLGIVVLAFAALAKLIDLIK